MRIAVIIPARYHSSRFEGKALAPICGIPMIRHTFERAMRSDRIQDVVVATDDERIIRAVEAFGGRAVLTSGSSRSGTDRVAEAAEKMGLALSDVVVNVQGDQPLLDPQSIEEVIRPFSDEPGVEMTTLAFRIIDENEITDPRDVKVVFDNKGDALYFSRSPIPFCRDMDVSCDLYKHLGVYAYTRRFLEIYRGMTSGTLEEIEKLEQLRVLEHGYRIRVLITPYDSPEVDVPEDIPGIERIIEAGGAPGIRIFTSKQP
ncbi:MAG: 3-deoxy-manno-octulosonate cytidylyltransferase [Desulfobacteraceae bacterium]|nr:MAG: 3-deoxy-manno-octulosonate cytidylyltransferase [Desulfobacteraceae bacterium]